MTDEERGISRKIDGLVIRLESQPGRITRWWLRLRKRALERRIWRRGGRV